MVGEELPDDNGYKPAGAIFTLGGHVSERTMEMLKTAFCLMVAAMLSSALMMVVYSREIATFIVERSQ